MCSKDIIEHGGLGLLSTYKNSPSSLIRTVYSNNDWLPWKFSAVPKGYWTHKENQTKFMNWLHSHLDLKTMEDWYGVTSQVIIIMLITSIYLQLRI